MVSTLFVYPKNLELYGFYGFLTNTASLFAPLVSLGFGHVLLKYFPKFRDENQFTQRNFLRFIYSGYIIGILIFSILYFISSHWILDLFKVKDPMIEDKLIYLLPLTILFVLYELSSHWSVSHKEIALPALLSTSLKILLPIFFLCVVYHIIGFQGFLVALIMYYLIIVTLLLIKISKKDNILPSGNMDEINILLRKEMIHFALYSMITGTSAVLALRIDSLMITSYLGTEANGKFSLLYFISNAAFIPALSLFEILTPFVSKSSHDQDRQSTQSFYLKSVRNMLIPTLWASLCIYFCFEDLMSIIPNGSKIILLKYSLLFLLTARVVDAATGINHHIVNFSKYYKWEILLLVLLALVNIILNIVFIPKYGIQGAALGTMISVCAFNIIKSIFIYLVLGYTPFDSTTKKIYLLLPIIILVLLSVPSTSLPLVNILIKGLLITIVFVIAIWKFNISEEYYNYMHKEIYKKYFYRSGD